MSHAAAVRAILAREGRVTGFEFLVRVEIKNDGLTQESTPGELAAILSERLSESGLIDLPWVLTVDVEAAP